MVKASLIQTNPNEISTQLLWDGGSLMDCILSLGSGREWRRKVSKNHVVCTPGIHSFFFPPNQNFFVFLKFSIFDSISWDFREVGC